jgi:hypothetical protein
MSEEIRKSDITEKALEAAVGGNSSPAGNNPLHHSAAQISADDLDQVAGGVSSIESSFLKVKAANSETK